MELPQFDYGQKTVYQNVVEREVVTEVRHPTLQGDITSLHFDFSLSENEFMVMSETYLYLRLQLLLNKAGADAVVANKPDAVAANKPGEDGRMVNDQPPDVVVDNDYAKVAPVNYLLNSMIKQATIEINGMPVTPSSNTFAYKAYLESLLMYNKDARESHLTAAGVIGDFEKRSASLKKGEKFELMGRIHFDLTHQPRPFPGGCNVSVKLDLNPAQFYLCCADDVLFKPTLKIHDAVLHVRRAIVSPSALKRIYAPSRKALRIPYEKSYVRSFPIRKGALEEPLEDVCRGRLPRRLFFCMVDGAAYHGTYKTDPLALEDFGLNSFACYVDGVQYPTQAFKPSVKEGLCVKEYIGLVQALNQNNTDSYANISYDEFCNEKFILGVNLQPDCFDYEGYNGVQNPPREGTLRIQVGFEKETEKPIQGLIYLEFDSEIGVGPTGVVSDVNVVDTR